MKYDHGPIQTYEVIWNSGHVERVQAHQVLLPPLDASDLFGGVAVHTHRRERVTFHGEVEGRWMLILDAPAEDIKSIRLVTADEPVPGEAS